MSYLESEITTLRGEIERCVADLRELEGRTLLGVVDGVDAVELVFDEDGRKKNLLTIYPNGRVSFGFVAKPAGYVSGDWP